MIDVERLTVARGGRAVVSGVDLSLSDGEVLGVVGPNGSGKTTLLMALWRSLRPVSGRVLLNGRDIERVARRRIATEAAVVIQEAEPSLALPIRDAVGLGRLASRGLTGYGDEEDRIVVDDALSRVGLTDMAHRLVSELSGGETQRVLIARAIAQGASHLLLDEPTNHLDVHHQFSLMRLIRNLARTTAIVLHDLNLAARFCDRIAVLDDGRVMAVGTPVDVLQPSLLEPIYKVGVERIEHHGVPYLIFDPS